MTGRPRPSGPVASGVRIAAVAAVVALVGVVWVLPASAAPSPRLGSRERAQLARAHAFTTDPVRFLLLGDSVALTLGTGLAEQSVPRFGVTLIDRGTLGCDLDDVPVRLSGSVGPATPGCIGWRKTWPAEISRYRPDVVGILVGRWEVSDHLWHGHWVHIGDTAWDRHLAAELTQAVTMASAGGAKVVLFTMPDVDPPTRQSDGAAFPENLPSRAGRFNALLEQVAHRHRHTVTVVDVGARLDPHGHFQEVVDGVTVRWPDGVHVSADGGRWLQPDVLPTVARLGLAAAPTVRDRRAAPRPISS